MTCDWESGLVEEVNKKGQSWPKGVKAGWKMHLINSSPYSEDLLDECIAGDKSYDVTFLTNEYELVEEAKEDPTKASLLNPEFGPEEEIMKKVTLKSGKLGMTCDWDSGLVEEMNEKGQSWKKGVRAGWKIHLINDSPYSEARLDACIAGKGSYDLTFSTNKFGRKILQTVLLKPGKIGMTCDWESGLVEEVNKKGQSWPKGVKAGWKMHLINSSPYSEDLLDECIAGDKSYDVTFLTNKFDRDEIMETVTMKPGKIGMTCDWESGMVEEVNKKGQTWKLGVRAGWKIHEINSSPYSENLLDKFMAGKKSYDLTFLTNMKSESSESNDDQSQQDNMKTVTFKPGKLEMTADWVSGRVLEVNEGGQSWKKGIRYGWQMHLINSTPYTEKRLDRFIAGKKSYKVTFITDDYDREGDSLSFSNASEGGLLDALNADFVHHMLTSCLKAGWFKICDNKFSYIVTGAVKYKNEYFKAAVCPAIDGKYDVCILDSQLADDRSITGFRFNDFHTEAICISLGDFYILKEKMRKNIVRKHKMFPWDRTSCDEGETVTVWEEGDRVELNNNRWGTVKFVGEVLFAEGTWYGIELDKPSGSHDGKVASQRYFKAKPNHGTMVRAFKIIGGQKMEKKAPETQEQSEEESATTTDRTEQPLDTLEDEKSSSEVKADPAKMDIAQADDTLTDPLGSGEMVSSIDINAEMEDIALSLFGAPQENAAEGEAPTEILGDIEIIGETETKEAEEILEPENEKEEEIEAKEEQIAETAEREQNESEPEVDEVEEKLPPWHSYKIIDPREQDQTNETPCMKAMREWFEEHPNAQALPPYLPDEFVGGWFQDEPTVNFEALLKSMKLPWVVRKVAVQIAKNSMLSLALSRLEHDEDRGKVRSQVFTPKPLDNTCVFDISQKCITPTYAKQGLDDTISKMVLLDGVVRLCIWQYTSSKEVGIFHTRFLNENGKMECRSNGWTLPSEVMVRMCRPMTEEELAKNLEETKFEFVYPKPPSREK